MTLKCRIQALVGYTGIDCYLPIGTVVSPLGYSCDTFVFRAIVEGRSEQYRVASSAVLYAACGW